MVPDFENSAKFSLFIACRSLVDLGKNLQSRGRENGKKEECFATKRNGQGNSARHRHSVEGFGLRGNGECQDASNRTKKIAIETCQK